MPSFFSEAQTVLNSIDYRMCYISEENLNKQVDENWQRGKKKAR